MKPWEKYQDEGPWTKYAAPTEEAPQPYQGTPDDQPGTVDTLKDVRDAVAENPVLDQVGRAGGMLGKGITGLANIPIAGLNAALDAAGIDYRAMTVSDLLQFAGAAQPRNDLEKYVDVAGTGVAGAVGGMAVGSNLANSTNQVTQRVGQVLQSNPVAQGASGATGAVSSQAAADAGFGPVGQTIAGFAGGVGGGLAVDAGTSAAQSAGRFGKELVSPFFRFGQEGIAGNTLASQADDPIAAASRLAQADDVLPGSRQTTGTASKDRGLMAVEKAKAAQNPAEFSARRSEQNAARQTAIDDVAGTEADVVAARAARDAETGQMREAALSQGGAAPIQNVTQKIDDILASPVGERKVVKAALTEFRDQLDGKTEPARLYEIRKDLGDAMAGKLGGDKAVYALARKQLIEVRDALDDAIEQGAPGFKAYLKRYSDSSKPIDNMEVLQEIQRRAGLAAPDITTGRDVLSQSKFRQAINRAEQSGDLKNLTAAQRETLAAVQADLDLGAGMAQALKTPGSDTFQNASVANLISAARGKTSDLHPLVQSILRPLKWIYKLPDDQIDQLLTQAMLDPKLAAKLLQKANVKNAGQVSASLRQVLEQKSRAATVGVATSQAAGRPEDRRRAMPAPASP